MAYPEVVTREEWLAARKRLLVAEKEATRSRDALNAERRRLPMVRIGKEYVFEGPAGEVTLAGLFGDSRQLIVQHVMFDPDWDAACPGCTAGIDELADGVLTHLRSRDTTFVLVSRAPLAKLQKYQAAKGWTVPWYSSHGSDFNYDFQATLDRSIPQLEYNYRPEPEIVSGDTTSAEVPGLSCFLRDGDDIFHTYSTYARGTDGLGGSYTLLDLTALGRQEDWEEPKGRAPRVHDADPPSPTDARARQARAGRASVMTVTAARPARVDEKALLKRASEGDQGAFGELVEPYRAELRAHCYRILGSLHDAEDALQDALLRAWRGLPRFEGRGSVRSWLYTIAGNAALDITRHRSRRELPVSFGPAADLGTEVGAAVHDPVWLEPYPDLWLTGAGDSSPETRYEQRESVELAFLTALQRLPPRQRAVLLLRDVIGFSVAEISSQLGTSVPAVNSALQRARATAHEGMPARSQQSVLRDLGDKRTRQIVQQYTDAMERGDADTLVSMLTEDATWSMPPHPTWFQGVASIRDWLIRDPLTVRWRHLPTRANGQLAVGCYIFDRDRGDYTAGVIDVLTMAGDRIAAVTGFVTFGVADLPEGKQVTAAEVFARFGLPARLP